jgi:hypothetical protein
MLLAVSLTQTGVAASMARQSGPSQARFRSTADVVQPGRDLPARIKAKIKRFLIGLYDELSIPKP